MMDNNIIESNDKFIFSSENQQKINQILAKYPHNRQASATLPLLDLAQRQNNGWVSKAAMNEVARLLDLAPIRVYEVATFYTMFNLRPVGKYHIQVCGTTPCWLRGSDDIFKVCQDKLNLTKGKTTTDKIFTLSEVECMGACVNAPMVQINDDYYEDLNSENFNELLDKLINNQSLETGSQTGRQGSAPANGLTTLKGKQNA